MTERMLGLVVTVTVFIAALLLVSPNSADAAKKASLQSAGGRWGSSYSWSRYNADRRSFRFKGASSRNYRSSAASKYSIFSSKTANRGSTVGSRLASSLSTPNRSYGYTGRYSSRQKITSYRRYKRSGQVNRGSTIRTGRR